MASVDSTPIRELSDTDLRKRLLVLGYDVPVSVNREFLVKKLENASAGGGSGGKSNKRHSVGVASNTSSVNNNSNSQGGRASPSTVRKRKSIAVTPNSNAGGSGSFRGHNNVNSTPMSPLATSSPINSQMGTPQYSNSPSISMSTPTTPSPYVSRLNTPSPPSSPMNNGDTAGNHSPRYMSYYNFFKSGENNAAGGRTAMADDDAYGYAYNRSIRLSAPGNFSPVTSVAPQTRTSERNGYAAGGSTGGVGVESDWCGGHLVSKILLSGFVLFFIVIGVLYLRQNAAFDPRGLTSSGGDSHSPPVNQPPPTPPPTIKVSNPTAPPLPPGSMTFPVCGLKGVDPEACIHRDVVKNSRTLFNALKEELIQRARSKGCRTGVQDQISLEEARAVLYRLTDLRKLDIDAAFQGMLLLVTENPRGGMSLITTDPAQGSDISSKDVPRLDVTMTKISATGISADLICTIVDFLTSATMYITILLGLVLLGFGAWKLYTFYRKRKQSEEDEVFKFVGKVLELLMHQYELSERSQQETAYLALNHIRDELVPPKERQKKEALWRKVVDYISNNESRVREEIQHISGEEFKVWRWLPSASPLVSKRFSTANTNNKLNRFTMPSAITFADRPMASVPSPPIAGSSTSFQQNNLYPNLSGMNHEDDDGALNGAGDDNNKWQGQAFETCEGSPNALPSTPTTCLKIRHMFTERDGVVSERSRIEQVILEKCRRSQIMHIGIDPVSVEGCVYIRCLTKEDARVAFLSLHGWWFDGHLLSVKFLREERYFNRFPEAKSCSVPLGSPR